MGKDGDAASQLTAQAGLREGQHTAVKGVKAADPFCVVHLRDGRVNHAPIKIPAAATTSVAEPEPEHFGRTEPAPA